ncbi:MULTISPECIES: HAD family hydrolase [unclassified Psychrobacillus]|uniref:HAD family hydrolase n=1 Tax=unclassified Psychrobacillus TaxID=2636677 RepID=UPI001469D1C9|nr:MULTISPECIES: HAD family hydrolase [unclassified Psychrobacillus]MCM3360049.1 HAD family hydrolase [Psychrobacillus sp. MER TA 171]NME07019.1 HAD family hydrolase [Psychrobacillus sp. BL-248-WT-3]
MKKKAVFFDLDDTLLWDKKSVETAFQKTCDYAAAKASVNSKELEKSVRDSASQLYDSYETRPFTQMIGINPFEGLWGTFDDPGEDFQKMKLLIADYQQHAWTQGLQKLGVEDETLGKELASYFPRMRKESPFVYEETFEVLDKLKNNYTLLLMTNGSPSLQNTKLEITPEISPYFDHIIISGAFGKGKPDPSIFEHALELVSVSKEEVLMVGDNLMTDILGASRAGIQSVWINREAKPVSEEIQPTYTIKSLHDLLNILEQ